MRLFKGRGHILLSTEVCGMRPVLLHKQGGVMTRMLSTPLCTSLLALTAFSSCMAVVDFSTCTFESDTCGWRWIDGVGDLHWKHGSSPDLGFPSRDHTFDSPNGLFVFIEEASLSMSGQNGLQSGHNGLQSGHNGLQSDQTVLESVQLTASDDVCSIRFAYYHWGGALSVEMNGKVLKQLSSTSGWEVEIVPVDIDMPSVLQFVMRKSLDDSVIAASLDDIQFIPCTWCTFESGLCLWTSSLSMNSNATTWAVNSGPPPSTSTRPGLDYTLGNMKGHYVYVEANGHAAYTAVLRGQDFSYNDNICSVAFCYHMNISDGAILELNAFTSNRVLHRQWMELGNQGDEWHCDELRTFYWSRDMRWHKITLYVEFKATFGSGEKGDIALDDIRYLQCAVADECMFAVDTCFWNNLWDSQLQWQLKHLPGTLVGNTLVANVSYMLSSSSPIPLLAYLEGPFISKNDNFCYLQISYSYPHVSTSTLWLQHNNLRYLPSSSTRHTMEIVIVPPGRWSSKYTLVYASWRKSEVGEFFIHSLQYLRCQYTTFESGTYWHDLSPSATSTWSVASASDNNALMPSVDHTYGKRQIGTFFMAKGNLGWHAVATTSSVIPWENVCGLHLWYYVSQGTIHLEFVVSNKSFPTNEVLWERESTITTGWMLAEMAVGFELYGLKIMLDVSSTNGAPFSVAVDDVEFTECADFERCSFEKDLCLWHITDDLSTGATWIRWRGPSPSPNSTLLSDHTRKTPLGRYLLMVAVYEPSASLPNYSAFLQGLPIGAESGVCGIEFWYHVDTSSSVTLTVSLESGLNHKVIWQYDSQHNADWVRARGKFRVYNASHVQFMATSSDLNSSTVAIDDITYLGCNEYSSSFPSSATPSLFTLSTQVSPTHPSSPNEKTAAPTNLSPTYPTSQSVDSTTKETHPSKHLQTRNNPTGISESSSGSVSVAAVAGGAVGGIVVILAVVFIVLFVIRPNKKRGVLEGVSNEGYNLGELDWQQSLKLQNKQQDNLYTEIQVGDLLPNPLYRNPRTFSSTSTFEDNVYATIGKNNGQFDGGSKSAENILYESSDKIQLRGDNRSAVNVLYEATNGTTNTEIRSESDDSNAD